MKRYHGHIVMGEMRRLSSKRVLQGINVHLPDGDIVMFKNEDGELTGIPLSEAKAMQLVEGK